MKFLKKYWSLTLLPICLLLAIALGQDADIRINLLLLILILFGFVFLVQWLMVLKKNAQLEKENLESELSMLKRQIDPHFYFNTLNNLYGLASRKSDKTTNVIVKLSEIMRYVIYKGKERNVSLEEEIQYIENYIELQELRINKSLDISFQKDVEDIKTQIAPLLLIIPIENAFKHGVDSLLQQAFVHISIRQKGEKLSLEVYNNFDTKEASKETGIGLQNLQKRLNLLYKNRYELDANKTKDEFNFSLKIRT